MTYAPGVIRDAIIRFLSTTIDGASIEEISRSVSRELGDVPSSSIRSYLSINTPSVFLRIGKGRYKLNSSRSATNHQKLDEVVSKIGKATIVHADCFEWLARQPAASVHAVVTDPPYGVVEYTPKETAKLRSGKGGVWRIPPSFDGHQRAPLPRFTTLTDSDRTQLKSFFVRLGIQLSRVLVPGANVIVASNPLLAHLVADALASTGLEIRGYIARQVMTMRGGDRPKNAHLEFDDVSVMPRSQWEPWIVLRAPLEGRVQDNLRKWGTGGFRRPSKERPFGDLIKSHPTPASEKRISPHPSLKPQAFMRQIVRAALPMGKGVILDPFMGGGSTIAAANAIGYESRGIELDDQFFELAKNSIPLLERVNVKEDHGPPF